MLNVTSSRNQIVEKYSQIELKSRSSSSAELDRLMAGRKALSFTEAQNFQCGDEKEHLYDSLSNVKTYSDDLRDEEVALFGILVGKSETKVSSKGDKYIIFDLCDNLNNKCRLFLFRESYDKHWKLPLSVVVAIIAPKISTGNSSSSTSVNHRLISIEEDWQCFTIGLCKHYLFCQGKRKPDNSNCNTFIGGNMNPKKPGFSTQFMPHLYCDFHQNIEAAKFNRNTKKKGYLQKQNVVTKGESSIPTKNKNNTFEKIKKNLPSNIAKEREARQNQFFSTPGASLKNFQFTNGNNRSNHTSRAKLENSRLKELQQQAAVTSTFISSQRMIHPGSYVNVTKGKPATLLETPSTVKTIPNGKQKELLTSNQRSNAGQSATRSSFDSSKLPIPPESSFVKERPSITSSEINSNRPALATLNRPMKQKERNDINIESDLSSQKSESRKRRRDPGKEENGRTSEEEHFEVILLDGKEIKVKRARCFKNIEKKRIEAAKARELAMMERQKKQEENRVLLIQRNIQIAKLQREFGQAKERELEEIQKQKLAAKGMEKVRKTSKSNQPSSFMEMLHPTKTQNKAHENISENLGKESSQLSQKKQSVPVDPLRLAREKDAQKLQVQKNTIKKVKDRGNDKIDNRCTKNKACHKKNKENSKNQLDNKGVSLQNKSNDQQKNSGNKIMSRSSTLKKVGSSSFGDIENFDADEEEKLLNATSMFDNEVSLEAFYKLKPKYDKLQAEEAAQDRLRSLHYIKIKVDVCTKCTDQQPTEKLNPLCVKDSHPTTKIEAFKIFYECKVCSHHTYCVNRVKFAKPSSSCPRCGTRQWVQSGMIKNDKGVNPLFDSKPLTSLVVTMNEATRNQNVSHLLLNGT